MWQRLLILLASVLCAACSPASAEGMRAQRMALVIGNAKYPDAEAPLKEPINDARDIAEGSERDPRILSLLRAAVPGEPPPCYRDDDSV